jgi:hypothetical protein
MGIVPSSFNYSTARGQAGILLTLITRGDECDRVLSIMRKNRLAALASVMTLSMKSIVWLVESTAR